MAKTESVVLETEIPEGKHIEVKKVLDALKREKTRYVKSKDISDINFFEGIKKRVLSYLSSLDNYRTLFKMEADRLSDKVKKEVRSQIVIDMVKNKQMSWTEAEKRVEIDPDYLSLKQQVWELTKISESIKGRYDIYSSLFSSVVQSVSIAGKEKRNTELTH